MTYDDRSLEEDIKNTRYLIYAPIGYVHSGKDKEFSLGFLNSG